MRGEFPIVSAGDLVQMISAYFRVGTTPSDVEKPSPEFVHAVFDSMINLLVGPSTFAYSSIEDTQFPDMFIDGAQRLQFFLRFKAVVARLKVKHCCFEDLIKPDGDRFIKQMSGVVNFMKFRDERLKRLQSYEQNRITIESERINHEQNLKIKEAELIALEQSYQAEKLQATGLDPDRQQKHQQCVQLSKQHGQLRQEHTTKRSGVNRQKDDLNTATFAFNARVREREEVQGMIVESPDAIKDAIQTASVKLSDTRDCTTQLLNKDSHLRNEIHFITKHGTDTKGDLEMLKAVRVCHEENNELNGKVNEVKGKLEEGNQAYLELEREVKKLMKDCDRETNELTHQKQQFDIMQKELDTALQNKGTEKCQLEEEHIRIERSVVLQSNAQVQEVKQRGKALEERHQNLVKKTMQTAKQLESHFQSWLTTI
eukprot:g2300.t1